MKDYIEKIKDAFIQRKSLSKLSKELKADRHSLGKIAKSLGLDFSTLRGSRTNKERLIGKKFGYLSVLSFNGMHEKNNGSVWNCRCDCGTLLKVPVGKLSYKGNKSCGCKLRYYRGEKSPYWKGYKSLSHTKWTYLINSAKKRKIPVTISIEDAYNLFCEQNGKCALTGLDISLDERCDKNKISSLDRIDSTKPYQKGNIQWVYKPINYMKYIFSTEEFIKLATLVVEYAKSRK